MGEYGEKTYRPHYHLVLFNFLPCVRGGTLRKLRIDGRGQLDWFNCCPQCRLVGEAWGEGDIEIGDLEANRAGYVAGYVENKLAKKGDVHLVDREPEFARMSLRPGIGAGVVSQIAGVLVSHGLHESELDVPTVLRHGKKQMPLGRYLRRRLRLMIGRDEKAPEEVLQALQDEMQELRQAIEAVTSDPVGRRYRKEYLKNAIIDANMGIKWKLEGDRSRRQKGTL